MASPFDKIDAVGQAAISSRLGEAIVFLGMLDGEYSRGEDAQRPRQTTTGVTAISPRVGKIADGIQGRSSTGSTRTDLNSELWISKRDFDALQWRPKRRDIAIIDDGTPDERRFEIMAVLPMEHGDIQILVSEVQVAT